MPSIIIREEDRTKSGGSAALTDIVYVPGFMSITGSAWEHGMDSTAFANEPKLCTSVEEFELYFGSEPAYINGDVTYESLTLFGSVLGGVSIGTENFLVDGTPDPSYLYAKELLNLGIPVLYESINTARVGAEGYGEINVAKMYEALSKDVFTKLADKGEYDIKYLTSGGYPIFEAKGTQNNVVEVYTHNTTGVTVAFVTNDTKTVDILGKVTRDYMLEYAGNNSWKCGNALYESTEDTTNNSFTIDALDIKLSFPKGKKVLRVGDSIEIKVVASGSNATATLSFVNADVAISSSLENYVAAISNKTVEDIFEYPDAQTLEQYTTTLTCTDTSSKWEITKSDGSKQTVSLADFGVSIGTFAPTVGDTLTLSLAVTSDLSNGIVSKALTTAYSRGDCVALIDHTNIPARRLTGDNSVYEAFRTFAKSNAMAEFGAAFTPWVNIDCVTYSPKNGSTNTTFPMPPSLAYLLALAKSVKTNANWIAVAGATRGQVPNINSDKPLNIDYKLTNAIAENRYQSRTDVSINAITNIKPFGYRIWGNRTLKNNGIANNLTATSFLNVRNLVSDVKKTTYAACKRLTFEQNNDVLWTNFKAEVEMLLDKMKSGAGISGYKIIKQPTTEKAKLKAIIKLFPIYAVEDFDITVVLEDDEVSVS